MTRAELRAEIENLTAGILVHDDVQPGATYYSGTLEPAQLRLIAQRAENLAERLRLEEERASV